ncbi:hypothetical protein CU098_011234, partial [Rhizopus stolonifer]
MQRKTHNARQTEELAWGQELKDLENIKRKYLWLSTQCLHNKPTYNFVNMLVLLFNDVTPKHSSHGKQRSKTKILN